MGLVADSNTEKQRAGRKESLKDPFRERELQTKIDRKILKEEEQKKKVEEEAEKTKDKTSNADTDPRLAEATELICNMTEEILEQKARIYQIVVGRVRVHTEYRSANVMTGAMQNSTAQDRTENVLDMSGENITSNADTDPRVAEAAEWICNMTEEILEQKARLSQIAVGRMRGHTEYRRANVKTGAMQNSTAQYQTENVVDRSGENITFLENQVRSKNEGNAEKGQSSYGRRFLTYSSYFISAKGSPLLQRVSTREASIQDICCDVKIYLKQITRLILDKLKSLPEKVRENLEKVIMSFQRLIAAMWKLLFCVLLLHELETLTDSLQNELWNISKKKGRMKYGFGIAAMLSLWLSHDVESNPGPSFNIRMCLERLTRSLSENFRYHLPIEGSLWSESVTEAAYAAGYSTDCNWNNPSGPNKDKLTSLIERVTELGRLLTAMNCLPEELAPFVSDLDSTAVQEELVVYYKIESFKQAVDILLDIDSMSDAHTDVILKLSMSLQKKINNLHPRPLTRSIPTTDFKLLSDSIDFTSDCQNTDDSQSKDGQKMQQKPRITITASSSYVDTPGYKGNFSRSHHYKPIGREKQRPMKNTYQNGDQPSHDSHGTGSQDISKKKADIKAEEDVEWFDFLDRLIPQPEMNLQLIVDEEETDNETIAETNLNMLPMCGYSDEASETFLCMKGSRQNKPCQQDKETMTEPSGSQIQNCVEASNEMELDGRNVMTGNEANLADKCSVYENSAEFLIMDQPMVSISDGSGSPFYVHVERNEKHNSYQQDKEMITDPGDLTNERKSYKKHETDNKETSVGEYAALDMMDLMQLLEWVPEESAICSGINAKKSGKNKLYQQDKGMKAEPGDSQIIERESERNKDETEKEEIIVDERAFYEMSAETNREIMELQQLMPGSIERDKESEISSSIYVKRSRNNNYCQQEKETNNVEAKPERELNGKKDETDSISVLTSSAGEDKVNLETMIKMLLKYFKITIPNSLASGETSPLSTMTRCKLRQGKCRAESGGATPTSLDQNQTLSKKRKQTLPILNTKKGRK